MKHLPPMPMSKALRKMNQPLDAIIDAIKRHEAQKKIKPTKK